MDNSCQEKNGTLDEHRRQLRIQGRKLLEEIAELESRLESIRTCREDFEIFRIKAEHLILKLRLLNHLEKLNPVPEQAPQSGGPADLNNN